MLVLFIAAVLSQDVTGDQQFIRKKADSSLVGPSTTREIEKVSAAVREAFVGDRRHRVIIVLQDQPQKQLYPQIVKRHLQSAETTERQLRLDAMSEGLAEDLVLESRRETALALERDAGPQQEAVSRSLGLLVRRKFVATR